MLKQHVVVVRHSPSSVELMGKFRSLIFLICLTCTTLYGLSLNDFVPSFLAPGSSDESSVDPEVAFSLPDTSRKRNASGENLLYCDRDHNVFCTKQDASKVIAKVVESSAVVQGGSVIEPSNKYFNRNSNSYDQNAINNFNMTDSNQSALQAYSPKLNNYSPQEQLKNNVTVPIQAGKDTNINVGQQQIEFNIKY